MCTEQLPPGGYPVALEYFVSYHIIGTQQTHNLLHVSAFLECHHKGKAALMMELKKCWSP